MTIIMIIDSKKRGKNEKKKKNLYICFVFMFWLVF